MNKKVYMDYAATHPLYDDIIKVLPELSKNFYNPSSQNEQSVQNRRDIEAVRAKIAKVINAEPEEIIITSGASESNSLAIDGFIRANTGDYYSVIASKIEHKSILNNQNVSGYIKCDQHGMIHPEQFEGYKKCLFCIQHSNNIVGTIQPIKEISEVIHKSENYLLCDITQSFCKEHIDVKEMGIDFASASGHKIGALKSVGFLYVRNGIKLSPIIFGTQERNLRGGTYNYLGIMSLGMAIDLALQESQGYLYNLRDRLIMNLMNMNASIFINGSLSSRLSNNLNICIPNLTIDSQQLVSLLDQHGYIVSATSSCSSGVSEPDHVLIAMGLTDEEANHCIRITLGAENKEEEIDGFTDVLRNIIYMYEG